MKNNPVIPYILIMAFGIGIVFFLSLYGVGQKEDIAHGTEETEEEGGATAGGAEGEALVTSCIGCHGGDLAGGAVGPNLIGLEADYIVEVLEKGIEGSPMTPGLKTGAEAQAIADYISSLE